MPQLNSLTLKNIVLFKDATLPLNNKGVTVIRGFNKDADRTNEEDNTNGSGKSLLMSALANIIVDTDAVTQEIKSRAKKDFFAEKGSEIILDFTSAKKNVVLHKKAKGKSLEYAIVEDGKDTKIRGMQNAVDRIKKFFPYTEEEFFTLYYIDSRRANPLQFGSATERLAFFTNLFKLNSYDQIRKQLNGMLTGLKNKDSQRLEIIVREIKDIEDELSKLPEERKLESKLQALVINQDSYNKLIGFYHSVSNKYNTVKANRKVFQSFLEVSESLGLKVSKGRHIDKLAKKVSQEIKHIKSLEKEINEYQDYLSELKSYERTKTKLFEAYKKAKKTLDTDAYSKYLKACKDYKELDSIQPPSKPEYNAEHFTRARALAKELKVKQKDVEKLIESYQEKASDCRSELNNNTKAINALSELVKEKECPTCQQPLDKKQTQKLIESIEKKSETLASDFGKHSSMIAKLSSVSIYYETKPLLEKYEEEKAVYERKKSQVEELKATTKKLKKHADMYEDYKDCKVKLKGLKKPKRVEKPKDIDSSRLSSLEKWLELSGVISSVFDTMLNTDYKEIKQQYKSLLEEVEGRKESVSKTNNQIPEVSAQLENVKINKKKLEKLNKQKIELEEALKDVPVLELLVDAYSNKGLKLIVVRQIAKMIERNMNHYAPLIYKEPITFKFEVSENRFDIYMERKYKKKVRVSDVRRLSGAEGRGFSFLLPLAILPLIPKNKRLNVMVLDEPTVNLDNSTKNLFMNSFIPKLCKVIEHIIVVTPLDDNYPNQKEYTVVKQNGYSSLQGG